MSQQVVREKIKNLGGGWKLSPCGKKLEKIFSFKGFLKTMSFVNAMAWEANRQMHHPDFHVTFNTCHVSLTTHDKGNQITEKDFLLAESIENLLK